MSIADWASAAATTGDGRHEAVFAVLLPDDSFGDVSLFADDAVRSMDAEAMEPTECLTPGRQALLGFLERIPPAVRHIIQVLCGHRRRVDESFSEAAFRDIPGRVARKLLDLAAEHGQKTSEGVRIDMRLTQRILAGMVAASRENVNRALSRLSVQGDIIQQAGLHHHRPPRRVTETQLTRRAVDFPRPPFVDRTE